MPRKRANTGIKSRNKKNNTKKLNSSSKISLKKRPTQINVINQQNNIKNVFHNTSNKNKKVSQKLGIQNLIQIMNLTGYNIRKL